MMDDLTGKDTMKPPNRPIVDALKELGYLPPRCLSIHIEVKGFEKPKITTVAQLGGDLGDWVERLKSANLYLHIVDRTTTSYTAQIEDPERAIHRGLEILGVIAMVLSVAGVLLNNAKFWPCFIVWIASNALSAYIHKRMSLRSLMVRDLIFLALAIIGLWQWTH